MVGRTFVRSHVVLAAALCAPVVVPATLAPCKQQAGESGRHGIASEHGGRSMTQLFLCSACPATLPGSSRDTVQTSAGRPACELQCGLAAPHAGVSQQEKGERDAHMCTCCSFSGSSRILHPGSLQAAPAHTAHHGRPGDAAFTRQHAQPAAQGRSAQAACKQQGARWHLWYFQL